MDETIQTLLNRRSVRKFKLDQITDEELNTILETGKYAPSGHNSQSPLFVVIQNKEILKKISKMNAVIRECKGDPYYGAPTVIIVLANSETHTPVEDGSLALGNMANAAYALGLGSCWINHEKEMFANEEGKALLREWDIEEKYIGVGALSLGYPEGKLPNTPPRKKNYVVVLK